MDLNAKCIQITTQIVFRCHKYNQMTGDLFVFKSCIQETTNILARADISIDTKKS